MGESNFLFLAMRYTIIFLSKVATISWLGLNWDDTFSSSIGYNLALGSVHRHDSNTATKNDVII